MTPSPRIMIALMVITFSLPIVMMGRAFHSSKAAASAPSLAAERVHDTAGSPMTRGPWRWTAIDPPETSWRDTLRRDSAWRDTMWRDTLRRAKPLRHRR